MLTIEHCECGGRGNDTLHDPATGECVGSVCEACDASLIAAEEREMGLDYDDREHCDLERGT
jgi:hypothetical protein